MTTPVALPPSLAALHRELGIPSDYAATRHLPVQLEATEASLVEVGPNPDGRPVLLTPAAARAWHELRLAAQRDALTLIPVSGFRSIARQHQIIFAKLAAGRAIHEVLRLIAAPGFSEHHTGRAIDIGCPGFIDLEESFASTPAFAWLNQRAAAFEFHLSYPRENAHGIAYEPWHWLHRSSA